MKLLKKLGSLIGLTLFIFIVAGDRFLPEPFSDASRDTRENINQFLLGLMPQEINNSYKNEKSDRIIKETEEGVSGTR